MAGVIQRGVYPCRFGPVVRRELSGRRNALVLSSVDLHQDSREGHRRSQTSPEGTATQGGTTATKASGEQKEMTDAPLPDSSELTREAFALSGWREALGRSRMIHCAEAVGDLQQASEKARDDGDLPRAKILLLLEAACSMGLTNKNPSEPFIPMWESNGQSSPTPDWFSKSDINFLAEILDYVDPPMIRGRLADLVWIKRTPGDIMFALEAIDSYRSLDLNTETWVTEIGTCWKRALVLTRMLGSGAGHRFRDLETVIRTKLDSATKEHVSFGHWLAETLKEFGLGRDDQENIGKKLRDLGQELECDENFFPARDYYSLAGKWFRAAGQTEKQIDMQVAVAEGWAKEAEKRMSSENPSALIAARFYDRAIRAYLEIPRAGREPRRIDHRIAELVRLHEDAGGRAQGEMKAISTSGVDISETVQRSKNEVSGKEPVEALNYFAALHQTKVKRLREISQENLENSPVVALIPRTMISHDGRVVARSPGMMPTGSSEENEATIWAQMIQDYRSMIDIVVGGCILPALEVMHIEHRFREADFITLARNSPAVPPEREDLFGKALFNGYEKDFATALHLLTPQIEHMVRYRLKAAGVNTVHTDRHGIQDEKGLSSLVEAPEFERIFGEDLAFEIRALFCDHLGANLRNNVSHGLFTSQQCYSIDSVYAWWLGLKMVFRTYWAAYQRHTANQTSPEPTPEGEASENLSPEG